MRDYGTVGFYFSGDRFRAIKYAQLARTLMGQQSNYMSFNKLPSHSWTRELEDGTIINLIQVQGGIKRINIYTPPDDEKKIPIPVGGIVTIPKSNEYDGWGFPYYDISNVPINEINDVILGTEDGTHREVIHRNGKAIRSDLWWPIYSDSIQAQEQENRGYGTYSELECGLIDWKSRNEDIILSWAGKNRYFNLYYIDGVGYNHTDELYRNGFVFTKAPSNEKIIGAAVNIITEQLIIVTYSRTTTSATYQWYCRTYQDTYSNDNLYDQVTEPDGWRLLGSIDFSPDVGGTDHMGSCVLFNESGTECVFVADQGGRYLRVNVDTEGFDITVLDAEFTSDAETYTLQIDDVTSGISGNLGTNVGGASMDLAEWTFKIAADYKGDDLVYLEVEKRLRYYSYREIQIDTTNTPYDIFSGTGEWNHIQEVRLNYGGNQVYLNNASESGSCTYHLEEAYNNPTDGWYFENSTGSINWMQNSIKGDPSEGKPGLGKIIDADLRYDYVHIAIYERTIRDRLYTISGEQYTRNTNQLNTSKTDVASGYFNNLYETITDPPESITTDLTGAGTDPNGHPIRVTSHLPTFRQASMKDDEWARGRDSNWSTDDNTVTLLNQDLNVPNFEDLVYLDGNGEAHGELLYRNGEWLYNARLFYPSPAEIIYQYSENDLDILSPIYTTELQHELKGVI